jgi:hypothetical protein
MNSSKNRKYLSEAIDNARIKLHHNGFLKLYGEISPSQLVDIDLGRVSHKILFVDSENNIINGKIEVLEDFYHGKNLKSMIERDIPLSIIPRIVGTINDDCYVDDCEIITFDITLKEKSAIDSVVIVDK